jgi:N-glycosidase YbiA
VAIPQIEFHGCCRGGKNFMKITTFRAQYWFLSNFFPCSVEYEGQLYPHSEAAYQAAKCARDADKLLFTAPDLTGAHAKKLAKIIVVREDWDSIKLQVMEEILRLKFAQPMLKKLLQQTESLEIEEQNYWGDRYWGICQGVGENHLGKLLMKIRSEL